MKDISDDEGFVDIELEVTVHASHGHSDVVAHDLAAEHSHCFALGRVNLAGHDARAGFIFRQEEFADATPGP